jgi:hypothetical protein
MGETLVGGGWRLLKKSYVFKVQRLGCRVKGLGFRAQGPQFTALGPECEGNVEKGTGLGLRL